MEKRQVTAPRYGPRRYKIAFLMKKFTKALESLHFISIEKVQEVKKNFLQESGIQFSELEEKVLQFHLSNLEYACGSTLDQVGKILILKDLPLLTCLVWLNLQDSSNRLIFFRFLHDPGTTMSFLPSSQETTLYSPRGTPRYSTNWRMVLTSAQSARFVVQPFELLFCSAFMFTCTHTLPFISTVNFFETC